MKKFIYILLCVIFGILVSFIVHVIIEIPVIFIMIQDFDKYSLSLTWDQLMLVHWVFLIILLVVGLIIGIKLGFKWWQYIYVDRKYTGRWFKIKD